MTNQPQLFFLKIARDEEELLSEILSETPQSIILPHPQFAHITAITQKQQMSSANSLHSQIPKSTQQ